MLCSPDVLDLCTQSFRYYSDMPARHDRLLKIYSNSSVVHKIAIYLLTRNLSLLLKSLMIHMVYVTHIYVFPSLFCFNDYNICIYTYKCVYVCIYVLHGYVQMLAKCRTNVVIKYNKNTKYIKCRLLSCQKLGVIVICCNILFSHI